MDDKPWKMPDSWRDIRIFPDKVLEILDHKRGRTRAEHVMAGDFRQMIQSAHPPSRIRGVPHTMFYLDDRQDLLIVDHLPLLSKGRPKPPEPEPLIELEVPVKEEVEPQINNRHERRKRAAKARRNKR